MSEQRADVVDASRRTRLANVRTFHAWLRTALTAVVAAIGAVKIVPGLTDVAHWPFEILGAGFAALAVVLVAYGVQRFLSVEQALAAGEFTPLRPKDALFLAAFAGVLGIATLAFNFIR